MANHEVSDPNPLKVFHARLDRPKPAKTAFALLLHSIGLSVHEAAHLLKVKNATAKAWLSGTRSAPPNAIDYLYAILDLQAHAANWVLQAARADRAKPITVCVTDDEYEANVLGWPLASVMNGAVRRFLEMADDDTRKRTTVVFNPDTPEERSGVFF